MKSPAYLATLLVALFKITLFAEPATTQWRDASLLEVEGKGWTDTAKFYDRLPARAEKQVRPPVWSLSRDSAGMCVRFQSDAESISVRWELRKEQLALNHMPASGVSGVDLYVKDGGKWNWMATARPTDSVKNEKILINDLAATNREYLLYFPLYNGLSSLDIGTPSKAAFKTIKAGSKISRPIAFYGSSILQGGCASRPGMAYPSILGRRFDCATINLGFSGNAKAELEVAALLAELEPSVFVIDCLPNQKPEEAAVRMEPFITTVRKAHPRTPIVLIENIEYTDGKFVKAHHESAMKKNAVLRSIFEKLVKAGDKRLYYVSAKNLLGTDGEATVDGTHPTDLGFMRMADAIEPVLKKALKAAAK